MYGEMLLCTRRRYKMNHFLSLKNKTHCFFILFGVLFLLRLGYGYHTTPDEVRTQSSRSLIDEVAHEFSSVKKNYASEYSSPKSSVASRMATPSPALREQKYEKTATIMSASKNFDEDENRVRSLVTRYKGIIQYEQSKGKKETRNRVTQLMIGVRPDAFDTFVKSIQKIGRVESVEVTKTDKTNEFLDLKAQRISLENARKSLTQLKSMKGNVEEFINLQYKILDVDKQLQELGVRLGDYDEVNEFCTVRLTLFEDNEFMIYPPTIFVRMMIAFKWTLKVYLGFFFAFACFTLSVFFLVRTIESLRRMSAPFPRKDKHGEDRTFTPKE